MAEQADFVSDFQTTSILHQSHSSLLHAPTAEPPTRCLNTPTNHKPWRPWSTWQPSRSRSCDVKSPAPLHPTDSAQSLAAFDEIRLWISGRRLTHDMHKLCRACGGFAAGTKIQVQRSCRYAGFGLLPFFCLALHQNCLLSQFCHWLVLPFGGATSLRLGPVVTRPGRQGCEQSCRMVWSWPKPNLGTSCLGDGGGGTGRASFVLHSGSFTGRRPELEPFHSTFV